MRQTLATVSSRLIHAPTLKNSLFGVTTRAVAGFSRIGVMLLVARHYGPTLFGRVALAMSLMEIFRTFSEFGLDTVALRRFSRASSEDHCREIFSSVLFTKLALASVFYVCCVVVVIVVSHSAVEIQFGAIASISLFSANLVGALVTYYQSQLRMHEVFWVTLSTYLAYVVLSAILIWSGAALQIILFMLPLAELSYFFLLRARDHVTSTLAFRSEGSSELLKESLPLGIMSGMILLYLRLDNVILYRIAGTAALGLYAATFRMIEPVLMVPGAFAVSLLAVLSAKEHVAVGRRELWALSFRTLWPAFVFAVCSAAVLIAFGRPLLSHFNSDYVVAYPALCILASCLPIRTANIMLTSVITSRGGYGWLAKLAATNLVINIALVLVLVPSMGVVGAAWSAFGTETFNMLAQLQLVRMLTRQPSSAPVYEIVSLEPECE